MTETSHLIHRALGIDLTDPRVRQRAWRRLRVFRDIAAETEADGGKQIAASLRTICQRAVSAGSDDETLICLALLAGLDEEP